MEEYFHCRRCDKEYLSRATLDEQSKILNTYDQNLPKTVLISSARTKKLTTSCIPISTVT